MCAMRRQAVRSRLVLVATVGAALAACGLDKQGTQFAPDREERLDAGLSSPPDRPDASPGEEASHEVSRDHGAGTVTDAGPQELAMEASPPDEAESTQDSEPSGEGSSDDVSSDDASPLLDVDATPPEAAAPATVSSCDQDGDGYLAAGPPCLGNDCCDTDPMVHPGQTAYFTSPSRCGSFDYDCDGTATPEYGLASCQWNGLGCSGDGFDDSTACGVTAAFSVCSSTGLLTCTASVGSLTQACR
jgi:hypothetical protein